MYAHWLLTDAQGSTFVDVEMGMDPRTAGTRVFDAVLGRMYFRRWLEQSLDALRARGRAARSARPPSRRAGARSMRLGRQLDPDRIARLHFAAGADDSHHARLADQLPVRVAVERRGHQPRLDAVELLARVAQAGDLHHRLAAEAQARAGRAARAGRRPRVVTFSPI